MGERMNQQDTQQHKPGAGLEESSRFATPKRRRDFLGLAALWSALGTLVVAAFGALRLPMPAVFPESNPKVKIGLPDEFSKGSATYLSELSLWVFRNDLGEMYAMSAVCTHLGCIARRQENGQFLCPCHGSKFTANGKVIAGPAPSALNWLEMSVAPDGQIVVDKMRTVRSGQMFVV
jgi:cytochrome b6-f complex iron-sulfur subunit